MSSLRPENNIHKFLVSSPCRFIGEFETGDGDLLISLAHSGFFDGSDKTNIGFRPGPYSRNYIVIAVRFADAQSSRTRVDPLTNPRPTGEHFCYCCSVLFGKRFDFHGMIETSGYFSVPDSLDLRPHDFSESGPYNHTARNDLQIPLHLGQFDKIVRLFTDPKIDARFKDVFFAAARFYCRALQMFDLEPDSAFLDLVTSGEILSNYFPYPDDVLFDQQTLKDLKSISIVPTNGTDIAERVKRNVSQEHLIEPQMSTDLNAIATIPNNGPDIAKRVKGSMRQIKRRFTKTLCDLLNDYFFDNTDAVDGLGRLRKILASHAMWHDGKTPITIEDRIRAAYDLRSQYLHTGVEFGHLIKPHRQYSNEVVLGKYSIDDDRRLENAAFLSPTFLGMERIIRFSLIRFAHLRGLRIDDRLDGLPAPPLPNVGSAHRPKT